MSRFIQIIRNKTLGKLHSAFRMKFIIRGNNSLPTKDIKLNDKLGKCYEFSVVFSSTFIEELVKYKRIDTIILDK